MKITQALLDDLTEQAKASPRLRMNLDLRNSAEDQSQRMLNAIEPGSPLPIHRHPTKDESFVILRGKVRVTTHNDDGSIIEDVVLSQESGNYGVDIPKNVWHIVKSSLNGGLLWRRGLSENIRWGDCMAKEKPGLGQANTQCPN